MGPGKRSPWTDRPPRGPQAVPARWAIPGRTAGWFMKTDVSRFGSGYYATAYHLSGSRVVVLGTHRADLAGVRAWLDRTGYARRGSYLTPAAGTAPGFYAKPYLSDVYYRIDPATGAAAWDGATQFGDPVAVTERDGFRG